MNEVVDNEITKDQKNRYCKLDELMEFSILTFIPGNNKIIVCKIVEKPSIKMIDQC